MTAHILEGGKYRKKVIPAKLTYRTKLLPGFELPLYGGTWRSAGV